MAIPKPTRITAIVACIAAAFLLSVQVAAAAPPRTDKTRDTNTPVTALRKSLGQGLAEHAVLVLETMRASSLRQPDREMLLVALGANTDSLQAAFGDIFGSQAATEFRRLWQDHIDLMVAYADAIEKKDTSAADSARAGLAQYRAAFSQFLASAVGGVSADAESMALQIHLDQLTAFADADYEGAYTSARAAYAHMFHFGDDLATAISKRFPERFGGLKVAFSPAGELRLTLDRLLGEHLVLASEAMRSGLAGTPDASAAEAALGENTRDLAALIGDVYGVDAANAFGTLWSEHTRVYVTYIDALRRDDRQAQARNLSNLNSYHEHVANFLADANPMLDRVDLSTMIAHHVQALVAMADAYAAKDYRRGVTTIGQAYRHMFDVGDVLAQGIAAQFPDRFKDLRLPDSDTVVTISAPPAGRPRADLLALAVAIAGVAIWSGLVTSRMRRRRR